MSQLAALEVSTVSSKSEKTDPKTEKSTIANSNMASADRVKQPVAPISAQSAEQIKQIVENHFEQVLSNIDSTLLAEQQQLKDDEQHLHSFVESKILPFWDVDLTLRLLVGSKQWKALKPDEVSALRKAFSDTLYRYVREGVKLYDGQRAKFVSAKLKKSADKGRITIRLEPIYLPSFDIHFKIAKMEADWKLYDIYVEGISYVKMKKNQYRQLIHSKGVAGLLSYLQSKNESNSNAKSDANSDSNSEISSNSKS